MPGGPRISGGTMTLPSGIVIDADVNSNADIKTDKMRHLHKVMTNFNLDSGDTPVTTTMITFVADSAGTIRGFHVLLADTGTTTDIDFDLQVGGSTVLSGVVNMTNSDSNNVPKDGTISSATLTAGDVVTIVMTVTSATGALGPFAWVNIEENSAAS